jgi:ABC-type transport system involved in multi-copper enzyme maturation permease subunit
MIWVTWRQFRIQAIVTAAALAAAALTLAISASRLASLRAGSGLDSCGTRCGSQASSFLSQVSVSNLHFLFYGGIFAVYAVPGLIGAFWGAPLVSREIEAGTFRLAWNQSVPRARWLGAKLVLIGLFAMATAGLLSLMTGWWASPLYGAAQQTGQDTLSISKLSPALFGATGIAPVGYAAFAFALGVTAGVLVRRTVAAMAITLAVFVAVQILWAAAVRPHLIPSDRTTRPLSAVSFAGTSVTSGNRFFLQVASVQGGLGDWVVGSSQAVSATGRPVTTVPAGCAQLSALLPCLARHGVRIQVTYQPASRYWQFQWLETGIFLALAAGAGWIGARRLRRVG